MECDTSGSGFQCAASPPPMRLSTLPINAEDAGSVSTSISGSSTEIGVQSMSYGDGDVRVTIGLQILRKCNSFSF
jgi:hypothetical protein